MNTWTRALLLISGLGLAAPAVAELVRLKPVEGAKVYLISPGHGDTVSSPVTVRFGLKGMGVAPAGIEHAKTGHHHLLINRDVGEVDAKSPLPFTDQTRHFGGGQTETELELKPGTYTLQMLFADWRHISFDPPLVSEKVTITVK